MRHPSDWPFAVLLLLVATIAAKGFSLAAAAEAGRAGYHLALIDIALAFFIAFFGSRICWVGYFCLTIVALGYVVIASGPERLYHSWGVCPS